MNNVNEESLLFTKILNLLERHFGSDCEIVLHDLLQQYDHTIIDIRNGHITGRKVGDCGSNLGLEVLKGTVRVGDRYNYITYTRDKKILRSSTIYFYDDNEKAIGSICINMDITKSLAFEKFLRSLNGYSVNGEESQDTAKPVEEFFVNNVQDLLKFLFAQGEQIIGTPAAVMSKEDKIKFLKFLDEKGAFLITKSSEKACEFLSISKFTLYKYLDESRKKEIT